MNQTSHALRLSLALCLITMAVNLQAPLYNAYAEQAGLGVTATSIAFSAYVLGIIPALLALGGLSDRVGRKPLILAALALAMLATAIMLIWPRLETLALARWFLGLGVALSSATAPAYMAELLAAKDNSASATWVTASTSLGFGLGAALTSFFLLFQHSLQPASFWLELILAAIAFILLLRLPDNSPKHKRSAMLRLPYYPAASLPFGFSILLSWATVGIVIAVLPSVLARHGLETWSGFSTFVVISCGLLFQPMARKLSPARATRIGLMVLVPAYALLAWGALNGSLFAVLLGAFFASSACYGFVYLGGLSGVQSLAGEHSARACAGFFLLAYFGFSLPVIATGLLADQYNNEVALCAFGLVLALASTVVSFSLNTTTAEAKLA